MELSPSWEAASCASTQEFSKILWSSKLHCPVHKRPSLVPILSHNNSVHTTPWSILILWYVNPLLGNARSTHTANNTGEMFSLCSCNLRMLDDVTKQYWRSVFFVSIQLAHARWRHIIQQLWFLCGPCGAYITRICCSLDWFSQEKGNTTAHSSSVVGRRSPREVRSWRRIRSWRVKSECVIRRFYNETVLIPLPGDD
jgi:hypothetical protein